MGIRQFLQFSPGQCRICFSPVIGALCVADGYRKFVQLEDQENWIPRARASKSMPPPQQPYRLHEHVEWRNTDIAHV
jgi:hypothetical protein